MDLVQPYTIIDEFKIAENEFVIAIKDDAYYLCSKYKSADILSGYFDIWRRSKSIREVLLPEVDSVLSGETESTDVGADIMGLAYIEPVTTKLMGSYVGYLDLELPTQDFRELIVKWLDFLEEHGK